MKINNQAMLKAHLKIFKMKCEKQGLGQFDIYPAFGLYYQQNKDKYDMPNGVIFDTACEILIEGV